MSPCLGRSPDGEVSGSALPRGGAKGAALPRGGAEGAALPRGGAEGAALPRAGAEVAPQVSDAPHVEVISPEGAPQDSQGRSPWNNTPPRTGSPERATHLEK